MHQYRSNTGQIYEGWTLVIERLVTHIINMSINTNTVPGKLKESLVTPLSKKGNKLEVSNYKPVSIIILRIVSNILERTIFIHIEK